MSTAEKFTSEQLVKFEKQLMAKVPAEGSRGNVSLMRELDWPDDRYWTVRNGLIDRGQLEKGRGKGGSVLRVISSSGEPLIPAVAPPLLESEVDLYPEILKILANEWAGDSRADQIEVEITGQQGSRITGKWSRPDITAILYKTFPFVPGKQIETVVFEIKPSWAIDVTAVYEALGHRRAANRAYVVLVHQAPQDIDKKIDEIAYEARRYGVGVIVAKDPSRWSEWEVKVDAVRHDPDPERLNDFLATQVSPHMRNTLMKWFK